MLASNQNYQSLNKLTVPDLKDILRSRGERVSGRKAELIDRILGRSMIVSPSSTIVSPIFVRFTAPTVQVTPILGA